MNSKNSSASIDLKIIHTTKNNMLFLLTTRQAALTELAQPCGNFATRHRRVSLCPK